MEATEEEVVEEVSVFSLIFPQGKGANHAHEEYLFSLTSASLEQLTQEPLKLGDQGEKINKQMQDLAFSNYKSFVDTSGCMHDMKERILQTRRDVGAMLLDLPSLNQSCEQFCKRAGTEIMQRRALNHLVLEHHSELLDLLEIPELMDTYVRGEFYDEALQLESFTQTLKKKHPDITIIQSIVGDVRRSTELMLSQLHSKLRDNIQLPVCLRVISHLRRLRVYSETQLRVSFLKSRDAWLKKVMQSVQTSNPYTYLSKLIDSCRVNLFDIITQYRAIFADDTSTQEESKGVGILYAWLVQKVSDFMSILEEYLPKLQEGGLLANILEQCMYYGMSLGRVGVDFRALLPPLFETCIFDLFSSFLGTALRTFTEALQAQKWIPPPKALSAAMSGIDTGESLAHVPPNVLLDYPPLALFTNGLLAAFNELRQCAPFSLRKKLTRKLRGCLVSGVQQVRTLRDELTLEENQEKYFESMCKVGGEVFLPYIVRCFSALFESPFALIDATPMIDCLREIYEKEKEAEPAMNSPAPALFDLLLDDEQQQHEEKEDKEGKEEKEEEVVAATAGGDQRKEEGEEGTPPPTSLDEVVEKEPFEQQQTTANGTSTTTTAATTEEHTRGETEEKNDSTEGNIHVSPAISHVNGKAEVSHEGDLGEAASSFQADGNHQNANGDSEGEAAESRTQKFAAKGNHIGEEEEEGEQKKEEPKGGWHFEKQENGGVHIKSITTDTDF